MGQKMGEDFAFEDQVCIILHNFAIFYDFDTFSRYRGCFALITFHSSPEDGGRWGRRWEKTLRLNISYVSFCIILRYFMILIFYLYRGCIALITFHSSPQDGGRWGRRWEKTLRLNISYVSVCIILRYFMILIPFLYVVAVLLHYVSLVPEDRRQWGRRWEKTLRLNIKFV